MVNALQSERDALAAQIHAEKADICRRELAKGRTFLQCRL